MEWTLASNKAIGLSSIVNQLECGHEACRHPGESEGHEMPARGPIDRLPMVDYLCDVFVKVPSARSLEHHAEAPHHKRAQ